MSLTYEKILAEDLNLGYGSVTVSNPAGGSMAGNKIGVHTFSSGMMNVDDFDASGDGVADDTTPLLNALTAAALANADLIVNGNYKITSPITVTVGTYLGIIGSGTISSYITEDGTQKSTIKLIGTESSTVRLDGITLSYEGTITEAHPADYGLRGINIYGSDASATIKSASFNNVSIQKFPYVGGECYAFQQSHNNCNYSYNIYTGFSIGGGTAIVNGVEASYTNNSGANTIGYGLVLSGDSIKINGGEFIGNKRYAIDGRRANNLIVDGVYIYETGYIGIYAVNEDTEKNASNITIVNSTVDNNAVSGSTYGIWVGTYGASGVTAMDSVVISGNKIKNCNSTGILVSSGDTAAVNPDKIIITGNVVEASGLTNAYMASIAVSGNTDIQSVVISNNQIVNSNWIGVYGAVNNAVIVGNISRLDTGTIAMAYYTNATTTVLSGNQAFGAGTYTAVIGSDGTNNMYGAGNTLGTMSYEYAGLTIHIKNGTGSPEGVIAAPIGSTYINNDGGASTTLYVKTSGTGNTGWTAK